MFELFYYHINSFYMPANNREKYVCVCVSLSS